MNNDKQLNKVTAALSMVQRELNAPKNRRNSFGNYNYRNCEDIVEAAKKVMPTNCAVILSDDIWMVGERYYVKATATFICEDQNISVTAYARESLEKKGMDAAMCTGASSSYARKYALNGLFAIDDSDDIDSHDNREEPKKAQQSAPKPTAQSVPQPPNVAPFGREQAKEVSQFLSKDQVFKLSEMIFKAKINSKDICSKYNVTGYEQLTNAQAKEIANECNAKYATV